jgi:hypothetical protein
MTQWRMADFLVAVPAPLQDFLAAQPQWVDQVSVMGEDIALTAVALEAYARWLVATARLPVWAVALLLLDTLHHTETTPWAD